VVAPPKPRRTPPFQIRTPAGRDYFIENVAANLAGLLTAPNEETWELIELAYVEASASGHREVPALEAALRDASRLNQHTSDHKAMARFRHHLSALSIGRLEGSVPFTPSRAQYRTFVAERGGYESASSPPAASVFTSARRWPGRR
jgi:hypothetical protein